MKIEEILPPLPEPWGTGHPPFGHEIPVYDVDQMRADRLACARASAVAALDEAAKECEQRQQKALSVQSSAHGNVAHEQSNVHLRMMAMYAGDCATAIRRLRDTIT